MGKRSRLVEGVTIYFSNKDVEHVINPHDNAFSITAEINGFDVRRILVEFGSSTNVLIHDALVAMGKTIKDLKKVDFPLIGFVRRTTYLLRAIHIPVVLSK